MPRNRIFTPHRAALTAAVLAALGGTPHAWCQVLELSALNGTNGFQLSGAAAGDYSGIAVSGLGDVNGEGLDDLLIGAYRADPNGNDSGASYVVFGSSTLSTLGTAGLQLSALDGANGFQLSGAAAGDRSGFAVSGLGDVNGDGVADLLIGAIGANSNGNNSGASYVVFGGNALGTLGAAGLPLSALNGANGFQLTGAATDNLSGWAASSLGDVNGDGVADLLIGAPGADSNGGYSGASYVVFGSSTLSTLGTAGLQLSALGGVNGFQLSGAAGDYSGITASGLGDVNGDGVADLLIGAPGANPNGNDSGVSYVVFGSSTLSTLGTAGLQLSALDGVNGFQLSGAAAGDRAGRAVSGLGDVNGDGVADLLIGAYGVVTDGNDSGASYVVFGSSTLSALGTAGLPLSALNGANGFRLNGVAAGDRAGRTVSGLGDVNGDGVADLLIGAPLADPNGSASGASYVVFGSSTLSALGTAGLQLSALNGVNGFKINGVAAGDRSGNAVSGLGDVNGDGVTDLLIGAYRADPNDSGTSYVVFGTNQAPTVTGSGPVMLMAVLEDVANPTGATTSSLFQSRFSDPPGNTLAGVAVVANNANAAQGNWQSSIDGNTWSNIGAVSATSAVVLDSTHKLRFLPAANFNGAPGSLSVRLWDGTGGFSAGTGRDISASIGGTGGFSSASLELVISITAVNDTPSFTKGPNPAVNEDAGAQSLPTGPRP
ncbi:MAG: integrin alpha [Gammaproteobacteria bacterium]